MEIEPKAPEKWLRRQAETVCVQEGPAEEGQETNWPLSSCCLPACGIHQTPPTVAVRRAAGSGSTDQQQGLAGPAAGLPGLLLDAKTTANGQSGAGGQFDQQPAAD